MKLSSLFQSKAQVKLLEYFLDNAGAQKVFNQATLANFLGLSPSTVARIVQPLIEQRILHFDRFDQGMKIFALNESDEKTRLLIEFHKKLRGIP